MDFYVYIIYSPGFDKFYIGQTRNIENRVSRHNAGTEKATKPYCPWEMKWYTIKPSRSEAMKLEMKLKNLSKERIRGFIKKYDAGVDTVKGRSDAD